MFKNNITKILSLSSIVFVLFVVDRLIKHFLIKTLSQGFFIGPNISIDPFINKGIAFSIYLPFYFIVIITVVILVYLVFWLTKLIASQELARPFWLMLLLVGGVSNFLDRLVYEGVVDYLSIWIFPVFNLADVYISLAVIAILFLSFKKSKIPQI